MNEAWIDLRRRPIDLERTLTCGQAFGWRRSGPTWIKVAAGKRCAIQQSGTRLILEPGTDPRHVARYLRLDDDLDAMARALGRDAVLSRALAECPGLRLVREDPWECLVTYMLAQNSTILRTQAAVRALAERYGARVEGEPRFPSPAELARASARELRRLRIGYRAPWIARVARAVAAGAFDPAALRRATYRDAIERLISIDGIGRKTADCIALYALEKLEAFPIDTWIRKALCVHYGIEGRDDDLRAFAATRFGPHAGYAQIYLFAWVRGGPLADGAVFE